MLKVWTEEAEEIYKDSKGQKDAGSKAYTEMQKDQKCEKGSDFNRKETISVEGPTYQPWTGVRCHIGWLLGHDMDNDLDMVGNGRSKGSKED